MTGAGTSLKLFSSRPYSLKATLVVPIVWTSILLTLVGIPDVFQVSEAREGEVIQGLLRGESFLLPLRQAAVVPSKPPLFHWITYTFAKVSGEFDQFGLRIVSLLSGSLLLIGLGTILRRILSSRAAILSILILATSFGYIRLSTDGRVDMVFALFVTTATMTWLEGGCLSLSAGAGLKGISSLRMVVVAFLLGAAVLSKGPTGLMLPLLTITAAVCITCGPARLIDIVRWEWVVALIVPLIWYYYAISLGQTAFVERQLLFENITRFFGGPGISAKGSFFYFEHFWDFAAPWSLPFALLVAVYSWRSIKAYYRGQGGRICRESVPVNVTEFIVRACLVWFCTVLVALLLSVGKRSAYMLLLLPPMSVVLGEALDRFLNRGSPKELEVAAFVQRFRFFLLTIVGLVAVCGFVLLLIGFFPSLAESVSSPYLRTMLTLFGEAYADYLVRLALVFLFLLTGVVFGIQRCCRRNSEISCFAVVFLFLLLVNGWGATVGLCLKSITHTFKEFAQQIDQAVDSSDQLFVVKSPDDESFDTLLFYLNRRTKLFSPDHLPSAAGYFLAKRSWLDSVGLRHSPSVGIMLTGTRLKEIIKEGANNGPEPWSQDRWRRTSWPKNSWELIRFSGQ